MYNVIVAGSTDFTADCILQLMKMDNGPFHRQPANLWKLPVRRFPTLLQRRHGRAGIQLWLCLAALKAMERHSRNRHRGLLHERHPPRPHPARIRIHLHTPLQAVGCRPLAGRDQF